MTDRFDPDTAAGRFGFLAVLLVLMAVMYALFDRTGFLIVAVLGVVLIVVRQRSRMDDDRL